MRQGCLSVRLFVKNVTNQLQARFGKAANGLDAARRVARAKPQLSDSWTSFLGSGSLPTCTCCKVSYHFDFFFLVQPIQFSASNEESLEKHPGSSLDEQLCFQSEADVENGRFVVFFLAFCFHFQVCDNVTLIWIGGASLGTAAPNKWYEWIECLLSNLSNLAEMILSLSGEAKQPRALEARFCPVKIQGD